MLCAPHSRRHNKNDNEFEKNYFFFLSRSIPLANFAYNRAYTDAILLIFFSTSHHIYLYMFFLAHTVYGVFHRKAF